jgi:predicted alpha/beta superfamily hydrolase
MISNDESALTETEVHYLQSDNVGEEFKILVGHCGASGSTPPPVLFVSDANMQFGTAVDMVRLLHLMDYLPPLLVVGIGYRVATIKETLDLRSRDLTPTIDAARAPATMGGAARFLAFIREELQPWARARFGVDTDDSTYFGDSFGGLFGTYVLFNEPTTFQRYGLGSPSLSYDNGVMFEHEAEYAKGHDDLPATVYFSVGEYENTQGDQRRAAGQPADEGAEPYTWDLVAEVERMASTLRARQYPSLAIECEVVPGEYHPTAPPVNLSRSLRFLFDGPR